MELTITKDVEELERLEGIIHKNLQSFYEVGRALMEIRNGELYKVKNGGEYETFEAYCKGVWDFQRTYAYHLIASVEVMDDVSSIDDIPKPANQLQTRPLEKLSSEKRCEVWRRAVETAPEGKVTAAHVYNVVKNITMSDAGTAPKKNGETKDEDSENLYNLKLLWRRATKKDKQKFLDWIGKDN